MSSDENEDDIPCVEECQERCENFAEITGTDTACAQFYLQDRKWDLQRSVNDFFEDRAGKGSLRIVHDREGPTAEVIIVCDGSADSLAATATAVVAETVLARRRCTESPSNTKDPTEACAVITEPCTELKLITWNIDGLSESNLKLRTKAVCQIILQTDADIIFLQEVIPESAQYFIAKLKNYNCVFGRETDYFVGTFMKKSTIKFENSNIFEFPESRMQRNLLIVDALVNGFPICFMNSHLESTGDYADERKHQLHTAFEKILATSENKTVIFAGDMNLRDKELEELGGLPTGIEDVWITCGSRKECRYTWDQTRNDNLQSFGRFKPRCRFDRLFLRNSSPAKLTPKYFGLIGLERLKPHRCFPSDHWGILSNFEVQE